MPWQCVKLCKVHMWQYMAVQLGYDFLSCHTLPQINVQLSICTSDKKGKAASTHAMKVYQGVEVYLHSFLTSSLNGGAWLASRPSRFTPEGNSPQYSLNRRLEGPLLICGGNNLGDRPLWTEAIILLYVGNKLNKWELRKTVKIWMQKNILKGWKFHCITNISCFLGRKSIYIGNILTHSLPNSTIVDLSIYVLICQRRLQSI